METTRDAMGDVLSMFSDPARYRGRLVYLAHQLDVISQAGSQPSPFEPEATLGVLQELARGGVVPLGLERAQDALMSAMNCYREALEARRRGELDATPWQYEAAAHFRDGHVLLSLAITLADAA